VLGLTATLDPRGSSLLNLPTQILIFLILFKKKIGFSSIVIIVFFKEFINDNNNNNNNNKTIIFSFTLQIKSKVDFQY
jgi:hypothetical protein